MILALCGPPAQAQGESTPASLALRMGDYGEAARIARPLADGGDAEAQYVIGELYARGLGLVQNSYEASRWYLRAAEQGHAASQAALGLAYEQGRGVPRNYAEAARWYRAGADQGQVEAQFRLGQMYERGYGVAQDNTLAYVWFTLAADSAAPAVRPQEAEARRSAQSRRTILKFRMSADEVAAAEELARAWRAPASQ
jgi:TPR repeat protein